MAGAAKQVMSVHGLALYGRHGKSEWSIACQRGACHGRPGAVCQVRFPQGAAWPAWTGMAYRGSLRQVAVRRSEAGRWLSKAGAARLVTVGHSLFQRSKARQANNLPRRVSNLG